MQRSAATCRLLLVMADPCRATRLAARLESSEGSTTVERCAGVEPALERLVAGPTLDAVLVALDPDEAEGFAALAHLRTARPDLALIVLAPAARPGLRATALAAGAQELFAADDADSPLLSRLVLQASELFRAQTAQKAHREAALLLDANPDAVLVADEEGILRYVNPAARRLLARGDDLVGEWLGFSVAGDGTEMEIIGQGEPRTAQMRVAEIEWDGRPALLASIRDISETRKLTEQLREAQKMEVTGLIAGGLAHDFNNLLVVIMGNVEFLRALCPEGDSRRAMVDRIDSAAERARQLTRQLLMFSRRQPNRPAVLDPNRVLFKLFNMLRRSFPSNVELVLLPTDPVWRVYLDPIEFDQILINLAFNARQAMHEGGRIEISLANCTIEEQRDRLAPGEYVRLEIADDGAGIAREDLEHIFEPFFSTREAGTGTGLGLTICQRIVRRAGGDILVRSEPGEGTTFALYLPRCEAEAEAGAAEAEAAGVLHGEERILVVEDDVAVAEALQRALAESGYKVTLASDGRQAQRLIEGADRPFDLVLSDVVMPLMTGPELADWLAVTRPGAKLLLMTGYTNELDTLDQQTPTRGLILKPFMPAQLLRCVRAIIDGTPG